MKGKIAFVLGAAVGYVLGSRAGRERYEQIKAGAERVWQTDAVQRGVDALQGRVDDGVDALKEYGIDLGGKLFANLANRTAAQTETAADAEPEARPASAAPQETPKAPSSQKKTPAKPAARRAGTTASRTLKATKATKATTEDQA